MRAAAPLLVAALLLFTANLGGTTLPPLDDCFYAQKGAEMAAAPGMTVRWGGHPAFQNPPGHVWVLAASFRLFGVNDATARLPTGLMAVGALAGIVWIGARLLSPAAGLAGASLLAVSPFFLNHGRRAMLEVPLLFWTVMAMAALVAWRRRPIMLLAFAPALGMAILTKSVLGLMPLGVAFAAAILLPAWRPLLRDARFWIAAIAGVALGASWPVHQWLVHGRDFLDVHFVREIAGRSLADTGFLARALGYPALLLTQHQPEFLIALPATWKAFSSWRSHREESGALLIVWAWLPLATLLLSSAQSARYVFPLMPAFALLGGGWLASRWPGATRLFATRLMPVLLVLGAIVFWVRPQWLTRDANRPYRDGAAALEQRTTRNAEVIYLGNDYWRVANPLLWYTGLRLGATAASAEEALGRARAGSGLLMCERARLPELPAGAAAARPIETSHAVLLDFGRP
ncbi:MAG: glycosyltransferase family 39 protein [Candidatus Eisenbacteria bacterium]